MTELANAIDRRLEGAAAPLADGSVSVERLRVPVAPAASAALEVSDAHPALDAVARAETAALPRADRLHLANWDRLRVIAALDTLSHHIAGEHALYGFGLPLFLILAVALGVSKPKAGPSPRFLRTRAERLLAPWLFWSLVFTGMRAYSSSLHALPPLGWARWEMLFYGPRIHLWFLPLIVLGGFLMHRVHKALGARAGLGSAALAIALAAAALPLPTRQSFGWPWDQWVFSLPAVLLGYALGRALAASPDLARFRRLTTIGWLGFAALAGIVALVFPSGAFYVVRIVGGAGLLVGALWLPNRRDGLTGRLTPLMLGVYILHPAVYGWIGKPFLLGLELEHHIWLRVIVTFPLTMLLVAALRKTPVRRFL